MTVTPYQVGVVTGAVGVCLFIVIGAVLVDLAARWYETRTRRRRTALEAQAVVDAAETITRQAADR